MEKIDIEILPEEAKRELVNFYNLLLKKYNIRRINEIEKEILADQIQIDTRGWRFDRDEIYGG